jgi:DDE superfamily endonuclease
MTPSLLVPTQPPAASLAAITESITEIHRRMVESPDDEFDVMAEEEVVIVKAAVWLLQELDDDDETESFLLSFVSGYGRRQELKHGKFTRDRIDWISHVRGLNTENQFVATYGMTPKAMEKLVHLIHHDIMIDEMHSVNATGKLPISPEMAVHCALSWLRGGRYQDIRIIAGISKAQFYVKIWSVFNAIANCKELDLLLPQTDGATLDPNDPRLLQLQRSFIGKATSDLLWGCVGAVDGWQCFIQTPSAVDAEYNVTQYFNGHYKRYGLNVQAMCDGFCRFTFVAVAAPGGSNDAPAYERTELGRQFVNKLPSSFFVVADNAYILSPRMLVPFTAPELRVNEHGDVYNFFLSQMRIPIEMAFGILVQKWRRFQQNLQVSMAKVALLVNAATRLHNFCINEGCTHVPPPRYNTAPGSLQASEELAFWPSDNTIATQPRRRNTTASFTRDEIISMIETGDGKYKRPRANRERRARQDAAI